VKAVLLDLDGTFIDSVGVLVRSFKEAFSKFNIDIEEGEIRKFIGLPRREIVRRILEKRPDVDVEAVLKERERIYEAIWRRETRIVPEALLFVKMARKKGMKTALVTSSSRRRVQKILDHFGIHDLFDCVITADEVEKGKPDPEPILKALDCLGVGVEDAIFVGDSDYDEEAAERAGIRFFRVREWGDFRKIRI